jgi:hypothetical protein
VLLNHLIRPLQERRRDREAEGLGGPEVDHQLKLGGLCAGEEEVFIPLLPAYTIEDLVNAALPWKDT